MIPLFKVFMSDTVSDKINDVLYSGYIGQGRAVDNFEEELKYFFNNDYCVTLNSGTSGLHLGIHLYTLILPWFPSFLSLYVLPKECAQSSITIGLKPK